MTVHSWVYKEKKMFQFTYFYIHPGSRVESFVHTVLDLLRDTLTHTTGTQVDELSRLETLLDVALGIRNAQSRQGIILCRKNRS